MRETREFLLLSFFSLLILAVTLSPIACASKSSEGTSTPIATPEMKPVTYQFNIGYAIEAFQRLPVEWQAARYINLVTFRQDPSLSGFYENCRTAVGQGLATIGIDFNKVDRVSFVVGHAAVYSGNLNLSDIRQVLQGMNYQKSTYLDIEIWESSDPDKGVVTLLPPNSVLVTKELDEAELCITVVKGWGNSLYDNNDIKDLISRLPQDSLRVDILLGGDSGTLATATSIENTGSQMLAQMRLVKFVDDANAESGFAKVTNDFNNLANIWNMVNVENVQIRQYVMLTGEATIADVAKVDNPLGYQTYWLH
jgi:hypothetical protein